MMTRLHQPVRFVLSAAMLLSSWGPGAAACLAQQIASGRLKAGVLVSPRGLAPGVLAGTFDIAPLAATPPLAMPKTSPAPLPRTFVPVAAASALPAAASAKPETAEAAGAAAAEDFARRLSGEELSSVEQGPMEPGAAEPDSGGGATVRPGVLGRWHRAGSMPRPAASPAVPLGEKRSAFFPLSLATASGGLWGLMQLVHWGARSVNALNDWVPILTGAASVAGVLSGALALVAAIDAAVFVWAMRRGREVTDEQFASWLRAQVLDGRLDANAAALVRPYRPEKRYADLTFAFASGGAIWVRPELAAAPWLLRRILLHELHHIVHASPRGPPRGVIASALRSVLSEIRSRLSEFRGAAALKALTISNLQRGLLNTQTSLRLSRPFDVLVINAESKDLEDRRLYENVSGGAARLSVVSLPRPHEALAKLRGRYRSIILGRAADVLPRPGSPDALRLKMVLGKLDSLHLLATRLVAKGGAFEGRIETGAWQDLIDRARRLREDRSPRATKVFEREVRKFWRQIFSMRLRRVGVSKTIDGLYGALADRGFAFLSFGPQDKGVVEWEKLLRYWEAEDGGQFRVTRVDLEDGGHLLFLRKVEARVGLWMRSVEGGFIKTSVENAYQSEEGRAAARKSLEDAGFGSQLEFFEKMEVVVRHVFGADRGRQEIYVTVPRRNAAAMRKFVSAGVDITKSRSDFATELADAAEIHAVKPVWEMGVTGAAGSIFWVDTGADATHGDFGDRLEVLDMVNEGTEDWQGHGTVVAAISISGNPLFPGMAKAAKGVMGKVFSRDQAGASDGDIMAAASAALKKGSDVISLSLGSRGSSADNLARFMSHLTELENIAGERPIVTASNGNSGPFDRTLSQPGAGENVLAVAAAAKSKDDGVPETAFYSSVGPDVDRRYAIKRVRFKPDITAIGGDVTTEPGSNNVYKNGVYAAKSKDSPPGPADIEGGKQTAMSGSSMSNPAAAAIALLIKLGMRMRFAIKGFVSEHLPFVVRAVLMRSARDMGEPWWFQGAGLVHAWDALMRVFESTWLSSGWDWVKRLKALKDVEDKIFRVVELTKDEFLEKRHDEDGEEAETDQAQDLIEDPNAAARENQRRFNEARDAEMPGLLQALKDPVWLVRQRAAAVLFNMRAPVAAMPLAEAALHDEDPRVRHTAFLALAEIPTHSVDALLQKAASNEAWDVGMYASYALARHGERSALSRILKELGNPDKRARFTAAWLLGQLRDVGAVETESLSSRVRDRTERGYLRHLAAASLSNLAAVSDEALSDRVVIELLDASGTENLALTRTIGKVFPIALRSKAFVARLRAEPLKPIVTDFVVRNRDSIGKLGALSEMVALLAKAVAIALDMPIGVHDPAGAGILGVDDKIGPVDLFVVPPSGAPLGVGPQILERFEATARGVLPLSRGVWVTVPEHKLYALSIWLRHQGYAVSRSRPYYPLSTSLPVREGGLTLELGEGGDHPAIAAEADFSLVRVRSGQGVSEVRVMAVLEAVAEASKGKGPTIVSLSLGGADSARQTPLSELIKGLISEGVGVVIAAGNAGPNQGTVLLPGLSGQAVVVAAASGAGLQFYSSRGTPEEPGVTWTDVVDDLPAGGGVSDSASKTFGTAAAAERSAQNLSALTRVMSEAMTARGRAMPRGWFQYLTALVKSTLSAMPGQADYEVGAGLYDAPQRALDLLNVRLNDPDAVVRESERLADGR
ncbi:MAG: S8 family serine peptidase [Elusimicrobiota bacterium]